MEGSGTAVVGVVPASVAVSLASSFLSSAASSRIRLKTRLTILPTTSSLGWAAIRRKPICWIFSRSWSASDHFDLATTWRRICAIATAQSSEPWICLRFKRLLVQGLVNDSRAYTGMAAYEMRVSIEASKGLPLSDLRCRSTSPALGFTVAIFGVWKPVVEGAEYGEESRGCRAMASVVRRGAGKPGSRSHRRLTRSAEEILEFTVQWPCTWLDSGRMVNWKLCANGCDSTLKLGKRRHGDHPMSQQKIRGALGDRQQAAGVSGRI